MDSRYLQSLIEVVDRGSIADAARAQNLTAAAVSQRILALERDLGLVLLSRAGHTAKATEACVALLPRARRIVQEVARIADDADPEGLTGTLTVGAISTALTGMLPSALRTFAQAAPRVKVRVVPGASDALYTSVLHGDLDAAILVAPAFGIPDSLHSFSLRREKLLLLSKRRPARGIIQTLQQQPYIRYDRQSWGGRFAQQFLQSHGLALDPLFDLDALEAITMLVCEDVGVSLIPRYQGLERWASDCVATPISDTTFARDIVLLTAVKSDRPHMLAAWLKALRKTESC
jgi:DNA-binding transcriptional LysR family regulator